MIPMPKSAPSTINAMVPRESESSSGFPGLVGLPGSESWQVLSISLNKAQYFSRPGLQSLVVHQEENAGEFHTLRKRVSTPLSCVTNHKPLFDKVTGASFVTSVNAVVMFFSSNHGRQRLLTLYSTPRLFKRKGKFMDSKKDLSELTEMTPLPLVRYRPGPTAKASSWKNQKHPASLDM